MPASAALIALAAHALLDVSWLEGVLLGAVLSPTDPVFSAAMVGRDEIPSASGPC
jgi:NhaP-type Na+/H+ or K+/H+ antiporter